MYQEFFGLREAPFNLTPDPRYLYLSQRHREALAALVYGVKEAKGFIALTGEIGSGKTTLCRSFLQELNPDTTNVALILNSYLTDLELLQTINEELGLPAESDSKKDLIAILNKYLLEENEKGMNTLLIVDEAQNLKTETLEQLRMLSNLETETRKLIQILLIGQPELNEILARPELEQLNQRVLVRHHISPLDRREIYHYIRHRLNVAGAEINLSVTPPALNRIFHFSGGVPRKINLIADRMLLAAYVAGSFKVDASMVARAERDLQQQGLKGRHILGLPRHVWSGPLGWGLGALGLMLMLMACVYAGLRLGGDPEEQDGGRSAFGAPSALPGANLPGLEQLPDREGIVFESQWVYDGNDIVRVSDPDFARHAAIVTVAGRWRPLVELDSLRQSRKEDILGINLLPIFANPPLQLRYFESRGDFDTLLRLDLPLVLDLGALRGSLSASLAMVGLRGETAILADPYLGLVELGLPSLEPLIEGVTVLYRDPDDLAQLAPGDENETLRELRLFLARQGYWRGAAEDAYNEDMAVAIQAFQDNEGLETSGRIDGPTAARIATKRLRFRPRLSRVQEIPPVEVAAP